MSAPNETESQRQTRRVPSWLLLSVSFALGSLTTWLLIANDAAAREAAIMAGIFVVAAALWATEALPLFATALLVIALQALLLANPGNWAGLGFESGSSPRFTEIIHAAADPVLLLFLGGFILAEAAIKEGVDRRMSSLLLRPFGGGPRWVLLGVMSITLLFGHWMSNTATAALMLALVSPMLLSIPRGDPFRKALVLGIAISANISGMGTPIASPPNAVALSFLQKTGHGIAFVDWMLVSVPLVLALTLLAWLILWKSFAPASPGLNLKIGAVRLTWQGWLVVAVFILTVLLWMTDRWHGLPPALVALFPSIILTTTRVFTREDLARIDWSVLILIAGGISLGTGMQRTGLDQVIVKLLPAQENSFALLIAVVAGTILVGTFMSNTAAANLFLPIGLSGLSGLSSTVVAGGGELHPVQVAMSIALAASMSMALPISTPPNAMAYARGEFTARELMRVTLAIAIAGAIAIILGGGAIMRFWGLLD